MATYWQERIENEKEEPLDNGNLFCKTCRKMRVFVPTFSPSGFWQCTKCFHRIEQGKEEDARK